MPTLKQIIGVMTDVTFDMLVNYIKNTFPNMEITTISETNKNEYQFILDYRWGDN